MRRYRALCGIETTMDGSLVWTGVLSVEAQNKVFARVGLMQEIHKQVQYDDRIDPVGRILGDIERIEDGE